MQNTTSSGHQTTSSTSQLQPQRPQKPAVVAAVFLHKLITDISSGGSGSINVMAL